MTFFSLVIFDVLFPDFSVSQSLLEVTDLSVVKAGGSPTMRACLQVPSTDPSEFLRDEDCQEGSHQTWTVWSCFLGPDSGQGKYSSWQNKR